MTTRPIATHARDWPLPQRVWELFVWLVLIAVLSIAARESYGAERPSTGVGRSAPSSGDAGAQTAADLAAAVRVVPSAASPVGIVLPLVFLVDD